MAIPNTTPTPNELYNGEMVKMNDTELRVVLIITRATLGWEEDKETKMRKKEDWISYYQLKQKTGRCYTAIAQAINNCIKMGWIEARDRDGNLLNTKNKRIGKKIFYRLGRLFLDKIETSPESVEVKNEKEPTSPESVITESVITESEAYKRNTIQKKPITKEATPIGVAVDNDKIVEIIGLFQSVSPLTYKKFFAILPERKAALELAAKLPESKIEVLISEILPQINVLSYVPQNCKAFKPTELLRNLDRIITKARELKGRVAKNEIGIIL